MSYEKILNDLTFNIITTKDAYEAISSKDRMKRINYFINRNNITKDPMNDSELSELNAIVGILQILYNSNIGSPIADESYDILQETLVDLGIPRLSGSIEINDNKKVSHSYTNLRGTLDKVYYLSNTDKRINKSRKTLDEWIHSSEERYYKNTGKRIDLNDQKVILTPKMDGTSCVAEVDENGKVTWITRGDTSNNRASDVTHIMSIFNDVFITDIPSGTKFEVMCPEENKDKINQLYSDRPYKNSRQIVTSILNSNEADFKVDYLVPVPLRIMHPEDKVEEVHPMLLSKFPTLICKLSDREEIRKFSFDNKYVNVNGVRFRTDGVVITILDPNVKLALGRDNNINKFEVAFKHTEEAAYSRVKDIEFNPSQFGIITPVLVINEVIMKGNTIQRISLSNKERFDELDLHYGDQVKILYDIIPYVTLDENCKRVPNGRKIEFIEDCPMCHEPLDLNVVQVQCKNPRCPSRLIGTVQNYCSVLRIQNIGYNTLKMLYDHGYLPHGIRSLYKLQKHKYEIQDLQGFGKIKTTKIINEINAKRRLNDYEFYGAIGIEGLNQKTFQLIFSNIRLGDFNEMIERKNFNELHDKLSSINGIGDKKADLLINYMKNKDNKKELDKTFKYIVLTQSYDTAITKGRVVFSGCRPDDELETWLRDKGYEPSDSWSNKALCLVVPSDFYESSKVKKAQDKSIPVIPLNGDNPINILSNILK